MPLLLAIACSGSQDSSGTDTGSTASAPEASITPKSGTPVLPAIWNERPTEGMCDKWSRGQDIPGFGGMFVESRADNSVYVYLFVPTDENSVEAVLCVFGRPGRTVGILQGQYTMAQLVEWHEGRLRDSGINIPGVTVTTGGIDEMNTRLSFDLLP